MLRVNVWLVTLAVLAAGGSARAAERIIDFSTFPLDQTPPGFSSQLSGGGKPGSWKVVRDATAPGIASTNQAPSAAKGVLAQLSQDGTDERFPLLVYEEEGYGDFTLTTHFKLVDGLFEQMAGIAFRLQDTNNFYYVRASGLGNSFRFVKLVNGQRLTTVGPAVEISKGTWHELTVSCEGNRITCTLDGKALIPPLNDNTFAAGKIAFWTKSDSITYFGETKITYTPHETLAQILVREAMTRYPHLAGLKIFGRPLDNQNPPKVIASTYADEVGSTGGQVERDVIGRDVVYFGKENRYALVTLPLHDRNGDVAAAVRVVLHSFPGQTEQNAVARAQPIVRQMENRIRNAKDLNQ
jgi:hypothetical protein